MNLRNKFQRNPNQISYISINENAFENVVCKMAAILSQPQCVKNRANSMRFLVPILYRSCSMQGWHGTSIVVPTMAARQHALSLWCHCSDVIRSSWRLKSPETRLFVQQLIHLNNKENIIPPHYWPLVKGIHRWSVNSPHKRPVIWNVFPYHGVIMVTYNSMRSTGSAHGGRDMTTSSVWRTGS